MTFIPILASSIIRLAAAGLGLLLLARGAGVYELNVPRDPGRGADAVAVNGGGAAASRWLVL